MALRFTLFLASDFVNCSPIPKERKNELHLNSYSMILLPIAQWLKNSPERTKLNYSRELPYFIELIINLLIEVSALMDPQSY